MSAALPRMWFVVLGVELALIVILIRLAAAVTTAFWGWPWVAGFVVVAGPLTGWQHARRTA